MKCPRLKQKTKRVDGSIRYSTTTSSSLVFSVSMSAMAAPSPPSKTDTVSWPTNLAIAQRADKYGYEAMVPVARWRGFGGESNFNGTNFETYTWAAGLGQATKDICVLTTSHVDRKSTRLNSSHVVLSRMPSSA